MGRRAERERSGGPSHCSNDRAKRSCMSYLVAQLGARMHYAVPRILHGAGRLEHFFTDLCGSKGWPRLCGLLPAELQPDGVRRIAGRALGDVPGDRITAFNLLGVRYALRRRQARSGGDLTRAFLWAGRTFCRQVVSHGFGEARGVYVFNSAGLEVLEAARARGCRTVLEQTIAPRRVENSLLQIEQEHFPTWQGPWMTQGEAARFCEREEAEWKLADVILCGSSFVRSGIAECGGPAERCIVLPYGVKAHVRPAPRTDHDGPLRVLVVGAVGLRKGSPYVLAAARALRGKAVFRMVGGIDCSPSAARSLSEAVELVGSVPHSALSSHLAWADVLLLPSLCEGSATAVYEALAASLPVICTANTGSVVRDGVDGFIVPIRDCEAIVDRLLRLSSDPNLRRDMAENARGRADSFDLTAYGRRLLAVLDGRTAVLPP
jgi:glycosyltransferase involved in cell wall biosynthesis